MPITSWTTITLYMLLFSFESGFGVEPGVGSGAGAGSYDESGHSFIIFLYSLNILSSFSFNSGVIYKSLSHTKYVFPSLNFTSSSS